MVGPSSFPLKNVFKPGRVDDDVALPLLRLVPLMQLLLRLVRQPLKAPKTRSSVAVEARFDGDCILVRVLAKSIGLVQEGGNGYQR